MNDFMHKNLHSDTLTNEIYESLKNNMKVGSGFHHFSTNIENNPNDLSNAIAFYKWWMLENGLWNKRINLNTVWE